MEGAGRCDKEQQPPPKLVNEAMSIFKSSRHDASNIGEIPQPHDNDVSASLPVAAIECRSRRSWRGSMILSFMSLLHQSRQDNIFGFERREGGKEVTVYDLLSLMLDEAAILIV